MTTRKRNFSFNTIPIFLTIVIHEAKSKKNIENQWMTD